MAKAKKDATNQCKPKKGRTTGAILKSKIGDLSFDSRPVAMKLSKDAISKYRTRAPDYIVSEVVPGPKALTTTEKCKALYQKGPNKGKPVKYRRCDMSLQFVGPTVASKSDLEEGAYLRVCTKWGEEPTMVPVKDHQDAQKKAKKICGCVDKGDNSRKCAQGAIGKPRMKRRLTRPGERGGAKPECLKWSKDGKRCLRRAKN